MSSILEALRELESGRPPAAQSVAAPAEQPSATNRSLETLGIVTVGLVLGALGFLLFIGLSGALQATAPSEDPPAPLVLAVPAAPVPAPAPSSPTSGRRPAWLETADPPRARVEPRGRREDAAAAPSDRPTREREAPRARSADLEVAAIDYSADGSQRSVTLRVDGATIRLREHESAQGVEVHLIQPDGVYVQRGADVFMLSPAR